MVYFTSLVPCKGHLEFVQRCLQLSYFRPADAIVVEKLVQLGRCSMTRFQHSNTVSWQREDFGLMLALTYKNVILYEDKYKCIMKVFQVSNVVYLVLPVASFLWMAAVKQLRLNSLCFKQVGQAGCSTNRL